MAIIEQGLPEGFDLQKESKTKLTYFKGETIFKQDAFAPYIIYIIEGLVKITLHTGPGKQINLRIAKKGDFLALSSIFGESRYLTSALALTDTQTCMIDKESLAKLLKENHELSLHLSSQNHLQERRMIDLVKSLSFNQMRGKLAGSLLYLSSIGSNDDSVFNFLTRQDIADFAGISLESAVKFLKEFEKENIIQLVGRHLSIIDQEKLTDFSLHA